MDTARQHLFTDLAMELIESEFLGQDAFPDMLALSYSTPDLIGHAYGPNLGGGRSIC